MSHWNCRLNFSIRFCLQQFYLVWPRCPRISLNCNDWTLPNGRCSEQLWGVGGGGFNWLDNNLQRMNEKLDAALRLYPISPWSYAVFRKQFPLICACLSTSGAMACSSNFLESSWQRRRIFYKPTFSKTWTPTSEMGWQLTEIWWNAISTKNMVHSCSTYCLMPFFWKRVITSSFVVKRLHCKLMALICLVS